MSAEENVSAPHGKVSPLAIVFVIAALLLGTACLANTVNILSAARTLDEIGAQCAYGAARQKDLPSARKAIQEVLGMHISDEFLIRGPIDCNVVFYKEKSESPVAGPFVTVKTSLSAWIPVPQLFTCSDMIDLVRSDSGLVELSAMHSSPYQPSK